tara:strand:- start:1157 stop:1477 length:321 start_codon:yes stop_codon:yes gene_type:complete
MIQSPTPTIGDAISRLCPGASFLVDDAGGPNETVLWMDEEQSEPSRESVNAKLAELQATYDAQAYARKREAEYPSIQELVVALYDTDDKSAIEAKRAAVKAKYPKG